MEKDLLIQERKDLTRLKQTLYQRLDGIIAKINQIDTMIKDD